MAHTQPWGGYRDVLHVRGLCHHACNRTIHTAFFRWLHAKAVLQWGIFRSLYLCFH